jgi:PKD repeat protein
MMSGGDVRVQASSAFKPSLFTLLVITLFLLSLSTPAALGADIHDAVVGSSSISDDATSSLGIASEQTNSKVAIDHLGRVHVVWQDNREGTYNIMYGRSDDGGISFGPSIRVNSVAGGGINYFNPSIAVDELGNPHVAWDDPRASATRGIDIYYSRSYDGGATFGPNVRVIQEVSTTAQSTPDVAVGTQGRVFVTYVTGAGNNADIHVSVSSDGGRTFGPGTKVNDDAGTNKQQNPQVVVATGIAHITWTDTRAGDSDIYYAFRNTVGSISTNVKVNDDAGGTDQTNPSIDVDDQGPVLVWSDKRNGNPDIFFARRTSPTSFSTNKLVNSDTNSQNQVVPGLAVAPGTSGSETIHVIWEGAESGHSDVYIANSSDGGATFDADVQVNTDLSLNAAQHRPSIAALFEGGPVVVTWDDMGDAPRANDILALYMDAAGTRPQVIVADDRTRAFESAPATAIGPAGRMETVWIDNRRGLPEVYHAYSIDDGESWRSVIRVNDDGGEDLHLTPDVAVGPDETVHIVWTDYRDTVPHVYYANNKEKTSGFNSNVRVDDTTPGGWAVNPSVAVAPNGSVSVAWLDGRDEDPRCRVVYSRNSGSTWQSSIEVPGGGIHQAPHIAIREGLVAVAFLSSNDGPFQPFLYTAPSVPEDGTTSQVADATGRPSSLDVGIDPSTGGPVHVVWAETDPGLITEVMYSAFDPVSSEFSQVLTPLNDTSSGPHIQPALAAGDGGAFHLAWLDVSSGSPEGRLRSVVPGLPPTDPSDLPSIGGGTISSPSLSFGAHQLSVTYVVGAPDDPDATCAVWENSPPSEPSLQSPANEGWMTEATFNLTVGTGTDADDDPIYVRFEVETPGGETLDRPFSIDPRLQITGAEEGTYRWSAHTTDGYGVHSTQEWTFTVDLMAPSPPEFVLEPEYTPGANNTLFWNASDDPGGGTIFYRVVASQDVAFNPPLLADSNWITETEHTFDDLPATKIFYKLQARDEAGNMVDATETVFSTQDTEAPKIFFVDFTFEAEEGTEVTFDVSTSTDDNGIASYAWDFDSDGEVDSTEASTTYIYDGPGEYTVTIVVIDLAGNRAENSDNAIDIMDVTAPTIRVDVDPGMAFDEDTTVTFSAAGTSDPSGIQAIRWHTPNKETNPVPFATGEEVMMEFPDPGTFTVELVVLDAWDNMANRTLVLTVRDTTPPEVGFNPIGPLDNTKVEFFELFVDVTDNGELVSVVLFYKTQDAGLFSEVPMVLVDGSEFEWFKDELAPGGKGNATYYIKAIDSAGNENKTDYQRILITGVEDPTPNGNGDDGGFDIMDYWWLILIIVVAIVGALGMMVMGKRRGTKAPPKPVAAAPKTATAAPKTPPALAAVKEPAKERALCAIEEVYFIHNDGRLVYAGRSSTAPERSDQDIFAGMFTAIQDFIKDSMAQAGNLGSFDYGENRIVIERGKHVTAAVTIFGNEPGNMRDEVREVVRQIEGNYAGVIERWDGDKSKLGGINEFGKRILALTGGIDRETIMKSKEKKGVKLLSEVEFFQGFVRLKTGVKNDTETVITDVALDIVYDDNVLRLDHIQPVYEYKRGKVHLGNVNAAEKKTVAFNFDPIICMESMIDGTLTYRDVGGKLQVVSMKSRRADIVCPIFFTKENANTAMLKRLIHEELSAQDSKVFRYPDGLAPLQAFELCKGVVHLHDVKFVREFIEEKPIWLGEAWFYGETKVKGYKIVIRVTVREDTHTAEFFVASSQMEVITGLLAELGHSLNRMLKEKYMGRLKAQPIVDQRLKKDLSEKPLLLERES